VPGNESGTVREARTHASHVESGTTLFSWVQLASMSHLGVISRARIVVHSGSQPASQSTRQDSEGRQPTEQEQRQH